MKTKITAFCATLVLAATICLNAEEPKAKTGSPEFERMKTLVGKWAGKVDMGQGPMDMEIQYRLLAGGSVLEEKCFVGTPNEMVTMYYDDKGKLALTHYCILGNRPGMVLGAADGDTFKFKFDKSCGIDVKKESHMHALTLTFNDADTITTSCKSFMDGKEAPESSSTFKRVKL